MREVHFLQERSFHDSSLSCHSVAVIELCQEVVKLGGNGRELEIPHRAYTGLVLAHVESCDVLQFFVHFHVLEEDAGLVGRVEAVD